MASYFIGIDSGTQGTKVVILQAGSGRIVGSASKSYGLIPGLPAGHKEQHPRVWIDAVIHSVKRAIRTSGINPSQVLAMGVSGQQHGLVPLDGRGRVIRPAKLWCDTSTSLQCDQIIRKMGGLNGVIRKTGNGLPAGFTASKILWLKQKEPKNFARLHSIALPHDYINFWLTSRLAMEHGDASGTGLFNVRTRKWCPELLRAIDSSLPDKLPPLQSPTEPMGTLCAEAAKALGLSQRVLVSSGGGDNMMAAIGTGNTQPGRVTASLGTSGTLYAFSTKPVIDPRGEIAAFCDGTGAWMPLLCTMNVTVATEMVRKQFAWSHETYIQQASTVPAGSDGLLLIPYLEGERTPNVPHGTGVFFGITPKTFTPAHLARSAMEGVILGMNYGLNRLRQLGIAPQQIRMTGGGSKNRLWRQIMADIFQCEIINVKHEEGAAFGAALQAWCCHENHRGSGLKICDLTDHCVKTDASTRTLPRTSTRAIYRKLQDIQDRAFKDMNTLFVLNRRFFPGK